MNLTKSFEFFDPTKCVDPIHIVGCGAVGSTIAENLTRLGLTDITLYDFDMVEEKNIANQMFRACDIGRLKVDALHDIMCDINPDINSTLKLEPKGYTGQHLDGYVFLAVDNIDVRRDLVTENKINDDIVAMFDFRMALTSAQSFAAEWQDVSAITSLLNTMQFTAEEGDEDTPRSACNEMLSVCPTIREIVALGVANFMNYQMYGKYRKMIIIDAFDFTLDAF